MKKKSGKSNKPNYVARESVWPTLNAFLIILFIAGAAAFAYVQFIMLPEVGADEQTMYSIIAWASLTISVFCFLWQIIDIIRALRHRFEFYDDRVVEKEGILFTWERQGVFIGIYTVTVEQSIFGKIFNYGTVTVDYPGYWDIFKQKRIAAPHKLKRFLEGKMTRRSLNAIIAE